MSGGSYNYAFRAVEEMADMMATRHMSPSRRALHRHLLLVAAAMRAVEWNDSGDGADEETAIARVVTRADVLDASREHLTQAIEEAQRVLSTITDAR